MPRKYVNRDPTKLNVRQAKFVAEYLRTADGTASAKAAGYDSPKPNQTGHRLKKVAHVAAAIDAGRKVIVDKGIYGLEMAMKEAQDTIEFARETGNANAMAKAVELRSKLNGLLVERHDVRQSGFTINIAGLPGVPSLPNYIDVTSTSLPTPDPTSVPDPNPNPNPGPGPDEEVDIFS